MVKFILDKDYAAEYARVHRFEPSLRNRYKSRCIDGRYPVEPQLPALAIPGADAGELAVLIATANAFGFELDIQKAQASLIDIIGGSDHFSSEQVTRCMHLKHVFSRPEAYNLQTEDIRTLTKILEELEKASPKSSIHQHEHREGAVLQIKGNWGVQPTGIIETEQGAKSASVFTFHQSLVNERHRRLADELLSRSAVKLFEGLDVEYLYETLSSVTEDHLLETLKQEAAGLPIYEVSFSEEGMPSVKDLGTV